MSTIRVRRLDASHDPSFGKGQGDFLHDIDAVAQIIKTRLLLFKGEWWEDTNSGLPLWQSILGVSGATRNRQAIEHIIQKRIRETPHVTSVLSVSSTYDPSTRAYSFTATVDTKFGTLVVASQ
jgi:hypothetical protein